MNLNSLKNIQFFNLNYVSISEKKVSKTLQTPLILRKNTLHLNRIKNIFSGKETISLTFNFQST